MANLEKQQDKTTDKTRTQLKKQNNNSVGTSDWQDELEMERMQHIQREDNEDIYTDPDDFESENYDESDLSESTTKDNGQ